MAGAFFLSGRGVTQMVQKSPILLTQMMRRSIGFGQAGKIRSAGSGKWWNRTYI